MVTGALLLVLRDIHKVRVFASSAYTVHASDPVKANSIYFLAVCRECALLKTIMLKPLKDYETVRTAMVGYVLDHFVPKHQFLALKKENAELTKIVKAIEATHTNITTRLGKLEGKPVKK